MTTKTPEQKAAEDYEPAEGDALVDAVRSAQADNPLPTKATSTCDDRSEAADVKGRADQFMLAMSVKPKAK